MWPVMIPIFWECIFFYMHELNHEAGLIARAYVTNQIKIIQKTCVRSHRWERV